MNEPARPLESETWAGAVDTVGSAILAKVISQTKYHGVVAACGWAPTSTSDHGPPVHPACRLVGGRGDDADACAHRGGTPGRTQPAEVLASMTEVVPMSELIERGPSILDGQVRGRWVVDPHH
jgi:acrylyl-CoA reductase (NADPH)